MSNPLRRASSANEIPKVKPLRPQFVIPQFVGQGSQGTIEGDPTKLDLLRRRVVPAAPTGLVGPLSQDFFADGVDVEEEVPGVMSSGSYFSNLMSNEFNYPAVYAAPAIGLPVDDPPLGETTAQQNAPAVVKDKGRSKNFSVDEDTLLVSAWLNVTLDGIQGADQSRSTYWSRIHAYFHAHKKFESDRSQSSLLNLWSGIQHDMNVFVGCLSKIEARNHSGWSVDDKVASACAMFKADDKLHRNFPYMHCWKILKDKPKWMERRKHMNAPKPVGKKQKTTANSSPSSAQASITIGNVDGGQPAQGAQERPAGKKKEKQKLRQRSSMEAMEFLVAKRNEAEAEKELKKEERCKKAFALQEERIKIEKERVELKREVEEDRIMNIDMSTLSYKQRQYYERRQDEILARRLDN